MKNQIYQKELIEIDLKELIWDILSQWKAVLIAALAMALLLCGAKYAKDTSNYKIAVEQQKEAEAQKSLSKDERIANVINALPGDAAEDVWLVVQEKEWIEKQKEYLTGSLLMNTDPSDQRELALVYTINAEKKDDVPALIRSYESLVFSETTAEAVGAVIDPQADTRYIGELIRGTNEDIDSEEEEAIDSTGTAFTVKIILPEEADAESVANAVTKTLQEQGQKLAKKFPHSVSMASFDVNRMYDRKTIKDRKNTFDSINGLETYIKNKESSLSPEQKAAVEALSTIINETEKLEELDTQSEEAAPVAPGISKKYAVLGFIIGAFLYAFCYVVIMILRGTVSAASGVEKYTRNRLLGEAYYKGERKGLSKLLHSDFVNKLHYKGRLDFDNQIDRIENSVAAVSMHAKAEDISLIKLTDTDSVKAVKDAILSLTDFVGDKGINSNVLDAVGEFGEDDLLDIRNAVMVIGDDTKISHLGKVAALCRDYDINLLGSIYFSEM